MSEESKPTGETGPVPELVDAAPQGPDAAELQQALDEARAAADKHRDQALRLQAEMENTRRRAEREVENAHKFALERFAQELLPVRDSLELGLNSAQAAGSEAADKLKEGTDLTLRLLTGVLEKNGVKIIDPLGQPFDPALHQAVSMQASDQAPNTVVMVMQKGYTLNDRLIRPAMVMVSRGPTGAGIDAKA